MTSTAFFTDHYELTMLEAALESGIAHTRAHFEVFARRLPLGRSYGVVCGTSRVAEAVDAFRFTSEMLTHLHDHRIVSQRTLEYLEGFRFTGDLLAYLDGELYFPMSPVLRVAAPFGEALLLETIILSILNYDSAIASAAARMRQVAKSKTLIEMGSRRTHEYAALAAARAAYICGFDSTSNLAAGMSYGIPTAGTSGHALILAHESEEQAFRAQATVLGSQTTALVDTYDVSDGIRTAIEVFGRGLNAVRIDSGELRLAAKDARALLDELGATDTKIIVSGDLDEYQIQALDSAPIDGFGIGTKLVTGSGYPTANFVYKLVAIENEHGTLRGVAKRSSEKTNSGLPKNAVRLIDEDGFAMEEWVHVADTQATASGTWRPLQRPLIHEGHVLELPTTHQLRDHHAKVMAELRPRARTLLDGEPAIPLTEHFE
ncbi:MAG: nicotinate phosphoribosyltransferase [Acidimicrobiales bacterium]